MKVKNRRSAETLRRHRVQDPLVQDGRARTDDDRDPYGKVVRPEGQRPKPDALFEHPDRGRDAVRSPRGPRVRVVGPHTEARLQVAAVDESMGPKERPLHRGDQVGQRAILGVLGPAGSHSTPTPRSRIAWAKAGSQGPPRSQTSPAILRRSNAATSGTPPMREKCPTSPRRSDSTNQLSRVDTSDQREYSSCDTRKCTCDAVPFAKRRLIFPSA